VNISATPISSARWQRFLILVTSKGDLMVLEFVLDRAPKYTGLDLDAGISTLEKPLFDVARKSCLGQVRVLLMHGLTPLLETTGETQFYMLQRLVGK
jgi:hypothetical protein